MLALNDIRKAYFIGIGGIGMSAIARYLNSQGVEIHGYDLSSTNLTTQLSKEGMRIHFEEDVNQIPTDVDLLVYTPAVPQSHQEIQFLKSKGMELHKRAAILGMISRSRKTIAVAGTHGKTTTTTLMAHLFHGSDIDPTAFLGGIAVNLGNSNYRQGKTDWVIAEADEYDRSFHQLFPQIAVVLAADPDHLDIYGTEAEMLKAYRQFLDQVNPTGSILLHEKVAKKAAFQKLNIPAKTYGLEAADYQIQDLKVHQGAYRFNIKTPRALLENWELPMPGRHNAMNALAAISVGLELEIPAEHLRKQLKSFKGIQRRFEIHWQSGKKALIEDYAHHPEELEAAIQAAREFWPNSHLTGVFQPHLFSRTNDFAEGFAKALDKLDRCILIDIYPARELPMKGVDSGIILKKMKLADKVWIKKDQLAKALEHLNIEVLMTLGAGDLDRKIPAIKEFLKTENQES